jgi:hypothetical protein
LSRVPDGRLTPRRTGRLIVGFNVTLTLTLTLTSGGRSAGLVRTRSQATEFNLVLYILEHNDSVIRWHRTKNGERGLKSAKEIR